MAGARRTGIPARQLVALGLTGALAVAGAGCGAAKKGSVTGPGATGGPGNSGRGVPARDSFSGSVRSGTGAYAASVGHVHVYLRPQGHGQRRSVGITIVGLPCSGTGHCLALSGTVHGTLAAGPREIPDVGHGYVLSGAGVVRPLGRATLRGGVAGTGFIARGEESLTLILTGASGTVTLEAVSPTVHGFSSP